MNRPAFLSLSVKVLVWILPPVLIAMVTGVVVHNRYLERDMLGRAEASAETYAEIIRQAMVSMMRTSERVDEQFLGRLHAVDGIDSLRLSLNDLRLRPHLLTEEQELRLVARRALYGMPDSVSAEVLRTGERRATRAGDHFRVTIPFRAVRECRTCHDVADGAVLAAADIHLNLRPLSAAVAENWRRSGIIFALFLAASLTVGALAFRRVVADPLEGLVQAARNIERGRLHIPVPQPPSQDELRLLAIAVEEMRRSLLDTMMELERLNRELASKNLGLEHSLAALRQAQEELLRAERLSAVGKMAGSIIHDFKNPMTVVLAYAEMLRDPAGLTAADRTRAHAAIVRAVSQMSDMTRDLLDFSRGRVRLQRTRVAVPTLLEELRDSLAPVFERSGVQLALEPMYAGTINVDEGHFRRALLNIITNAQEAMPDGGTVSVVVERLDGFAEFRISDTGTGIPDEVRSHMFEPFITYGKPRGTGLGLAITRLVVLEHGGRIDVTSAFGSGTTFSLAVPVGEDPPAT
jgi:two-component system NtrC family sensor kinase